MVVAVCDEGLQQGKGQGIKGKLELGSRESCLARTLGGLDGLWCFRYLKLV